MFCTDLVPYPKKRKKRMSKIPEVIKKALLQASPYQYEVGPHPDIPKVWRYTVRYGLSQKHVASGSELSRQTAEKMVAKYIEQHAEQKHQEKLEWDIIREEKDAATKRANEKIDKLRKELTTKKSMDQWTNSHTLRATTGNKKATKKTKKEKYPPSVQKLHREQHL